MKIHVLIAALISVMLLACEPDREILTSEPSSQTQPKLGITSVSITPDENAPVANTYEVLVHFNRALTSEELKPATGYTHTYGIKFRLASRNGWVYESWSISPVQEGLVRDNGETYWLTSEASHHPPRGLNKKTEKVLTPELISSVEVELYKQDKTDRMSEYELIEKKLFDL